MPLFLYPPATFDAPCIIRFHSFSFPEYPHKLAAAVLIDQIYPCTLAADDLIHQICSRNLATGDLIH